MTEPTARTEPTADPATGITADNVPVAVETVETATGAAEPAETAIEAVELSVESAGITVETANGAAEPTADPATGAAELSVGSAGINVETATAPADHAREGATAPAAGNSAEPAESVAPAVKPATEATAETASEATAPAAENSAEPAESVDPVGKPATEATVETASEATAPAADNATASMESIDHIDHIDAAHDDLTESFAADPIPLAVADDAPIDPSASAAESPSASAAESPSAGKSFFLSDVVVTRIDGVRSRESKRDMNYFYCRPHHALIYKVSGEMTCWFGKREVSFSKNDIVYIPRGLTYRSKLRSDGRYIIIDFDTLEDYPADEIIVARFENHSNLYSLFSKCAEEWAFRDTAHNLGCKAYIYKILALMARQLDGSDKELRAKLAPAIDYMHLHINDQSLTIERLAEAAGMSEPYFRSLFGQLYIVSPKRYIISVRIGQAKSMLEEGTSVARTAEAVGFTDTESFTRLFRREAGMSPRDWANRAPGLRKK